MWHDFSKVTDGYNSDWETRWIDPMVCLQRQQAFGKKVIQETFFMHLKPKSRSWGEKEKKKGYQTLG